MTPWFEGLAACLEAVQFDGSPWHPRASERLLFVGNGGSAAIASHMAIDYSKNGGIQAAAFNDPALLTCLANDCGFEHVFERAIELHADPERDVLVAISSSGRSPNILNAVAAARRKGMPVITLSGFDADNPLRSLGDANYYVPSHDYGHVEVTHLAILHSMVSA